MSDLDYQYEQYLISQAIEQCEAGEDENGRAAAYLRSLSICTQCYEDTDSDGDCTNPDCCEFKEDS